MEKTGWKILAIVLIVILALESVIVFWILSIGFSELERENVCSTNICELGNQDAKYDSYYYDSYDGSCYCYKNGEVLHQEILTGEVIAK